jgi:hypothetical protein
MLLAFLYSGFVITNINFIPPHKQTQSILTFVSTVSTVIQTISTTAVILITKAPITSQI